MLARTYALATACLLTAFAALGTAAAESGHAENVVEAPAPKRAHPQTVPIGVSVTDTYANWAVDTCTEKHGFTQFVSGDEETIFGTSTLDHNGLRVWELNRTYSILASGEIVDVREYPVPISQEQDDKLCCICMIEYQGAIVQCACYNTTQCCCWANVNLDPLGATCYCRCGSLTCG